jgi:hypothetical protein
MFVGPNIVTDGLFISLDAASTRSYPSSGNTWYDLSGNGNNATTYNTISHNTTSSGEFHMDGGNELIYISPSSDFDHFKSGDFTIETFVRSDNKVYPQSRHPMRLGHTVYSGNKGWSVGHQTCNNNIEVRVSDGTNTSFTDLTHDDLEESTYYHRVFSVSRDSGCATTYYLNGELVGTHNATSVTGEIYDPNQSSDYLTAGLSFGYNWGWRFVGSINIIKVYNRVLSSSEVLQNYNSTKSRFGL